MDYIGGIDGMKFNPISNYNKYLNNTASFDVDTSGNGFEAVLNQQTQALQNVSPVQGGIEVTNFADLIPSETASVTNASPSGNFLDNLSHSINGGLSSVNEKMDAANKAQEAFAMGEDVSVHDVMIAAEKAQLSFQMAMQLRNKIMNAYTEINSIKV